MMRYTGALELSEAVASKRYGVVDAVGDCLRLIEENGGLYNAFASVSKERALAKAAGVRVENFRKRWKRFT